MLRTAAPAATLLALLVAACGGTGAYDVCRANCGAAENCGYRNDTQTASCYSVCDANKPLYDQQDSGLALQCKNADELRRQQLACYTKTPCGASVSEYTQATSKCIASPAATTCVRN